MAKIFLTGDREPLIVEDKKARQIEQDLLNGCLDQTIKIGETLITNAPRQIKLIRLDEEIRDEEREDLEKKTTQELKTIIGDWEQRRKEAVKKADKFVMNNVLGTVRQGIVDLYELMGAIAKNDNKYGNSYWSVVVFEGETENKYLQLQRIEEAYSVLLKRREYAARVSKM